MTPSTILSARSASFTAVSSSAFNQLRYLCIWRKRRTPPRRSHIGSMMKFMIPETASSARAPLEAESPSREISEDARNTRMRWRRPRLQG